MIQRLTAYIQKQFSLDARALAWMRICFGLILITDWIIRLNSFNAHYTNEGVMPLNVLFDYQWRRGFFSLFIFSESHTYTAILFGFALLFAFFLAIGYFTRFSTLMSWILLCSVHARNPFILQGGDELLRIALMWGIFLPLGRFYSVDSYHTKNIVKQTQVFSMAAFGLMLLVFGVYFFSALQKTSVEWRSEGTAIYYALSLDQMALPLGKLLLNYPGICKLLTHIVFYIELIAPVLFFIPYKNHLLRLTGILLLLLMHIGIGTTLFVGLFFLIGISTLAGLLPKEFVDWKLRKIPAVFKKINLLPLFARVLPSFTSLRLKGFKVLSGITNFYTLTVFSFTLLFIICVSVIWNLGNIPGTGLTVTGPFRHMVYFLRLDENWGMFSPGVFKDDGWFIAEAETHAHQKIDLNRNGANVTYDKPESILANIKDDRWRKFGENYIMIDYEYIRPAYCKFLLRNWNTEHTEAEQIDSLTIIYMKERTLPSYQQPEITQEILCTCKK